MRPNMAHKYTVHNGAFLLTLCMLNIADTQTKKQVPVKVRPVDTEPADSEKNKKPINIDDIKPQHPKALVAKYSIKEKSKEELKKNKETYNELSRKVLKSMNETQLRTFVNTCIALEYYDEAIRALEHLILETKNTITAKDARLEIADLYFEKGAFKEAGDKYNDFIKLYPADRAVEYCQYKAIVSFFYCLPTHDRDQKRTQEVVVMADSLLKKEHPFKTDIINIRSYCYNKLYQHNADIFNQYLKKGSYAAAEKRLSHIKKTFTTAMVTDLEVITLTLDYKLACAKKDVPYALELEQKLAGYPGANFVKVASLEIKKPYVDYF